MSRGMLLWDSILAGVQVVAGASVLLEWIGPKWFGLIVVVVAGVQMATATYKRGLAMPVPDPVQDMFSREKPDGWGSADVKGYPSGEDR